MSGGFFDYVQFRLDEPIEDISKILINNEKKTEEDKIPKEVIEELKKGIKNLEISKIYLQRIDWLLSGDDNENDFLERLKEELNQLNQLNQKWKENEMNYCGNHGGIVGLIDDSMYYIEKNIDVKANDDINISFYCDDDDEYFLVIDNITGEEFKCNDVKDYDNPKSFQAQYKKYNELVNSKNIMFDFP